MVELTKLRSTQPMSPDRVHHCHTVHSSVHRSDFFVFCRDEIGSMKQMRKYNAVRCCCIVSIRTMILICFLNEIHFLGIKDKRSLSVVIKSV